MKHMYHSKRRKLSTADFDMVLQSKNVEVRFSLCKYVTLALGFSSLTVCHWLLESRVLFVHAHTHTDSLIQTHYCLNIALIIILLGYWHFIIVYSSIILKTLWQYPVQYKWLTSVPVSLMLIVTLSPFLTGRMFVRQEHTLATSTNYDSFLNWTFSSPNMVWTVQTLLHSQLACNEMKASARTCGRRAADSIIENVG